MGNMKRYDPDRDLKLRFLKVLVNWPLRILDRFLNFPKPRYPQTIMVMNLYATLRKVYGVEVSQGVFKEKDCRADGNFERAITVAAKVLSQVCERDRYYRAWIGLLVTLADRQLQLMDADPAVLKRLVKEQWLADIDCLPDSVVAANMRDFREVALCDYLGNLARMPASKA
jgi:hypothetical protein